MYNNNNIKNKKEGDFNKRVNTALLKLKYSYDLSNSYIAIAGKLKRHILLTRDENGVCIVNRIPFVVLIDEFNMLTIYAIYRNKIYDIDKLDNDSELKNKILEMRNIFCY